MKTLASVLRRLANRLDPPQPVWNPFWPNTAASTAKIWYEGKRVL